MSAVRTCTAVLTAALLGLAQTAPARAEAPSGGVLQYAPDASNVLVVIRMDQLLANDGFKKLLKEIPDLHKEMTTGFRKEFGFDLSNVESMRVVGSVNHKPPIGTFRLKKAEDVKAILKAREEPPGFKDDKPITHRKEKVGAVTVYVPSDEHRDSFCFPNEKTVLFGTAKELNAVLERNKEAAVSDGLTAALKEADPAATVTLALDLKALLDSEKPPPIPGGDFDKIKAAVSGAVLTVKVGTDVALRTAAVCKDAKAAEEAKTQAEAILKALMELMKKAPPGAVPKDVLDLPGKVKLAAKGNVAEATLTVPSDVAVAFIRAMSVPTVKETTPPKPVEKKP